MATRTPSKRPAKPARSGQSALKASEARYRRLFETAQDAILILDAEQNPGKIMDANPFVIDLLGYSLDELIGKELWEIGLFSDKQESKAAMEELQQNGYIRYEDIPLETKQGKRVEVEFVSNTYRVDGHDVIQCNIRDITERAQAVHALRESEARYRRLFETAQDAILILEEAGGKIMDANPFVIDLLGYSLDELIGKQLWEIGLFSDKQESKAAMERLQQDGYIRYEDMPLETKRGARVEVEFVSNSYMVGDLKVIQCNIRDITDRKWAEEAARISSERFRFLAESMPLIIFTAKPDGEIDYCNRQFTQFTGLPSEDHCTSGRVPITHPEDVEEDDRLWRRAIETGEPFQLESRFRRSDGVYRWHLTRASAMRDAEGRILMWVGSSTDIDDRKSVEEGLIRQYRESEILSRAKDEFLATSSHELRTPLTSILGWSELLVTGELDAETQREALDSIRDSARAQSRLIDDMLDVSRLLTGKLELKSEPVDVAAALLLAIRAITPAAENKSIHVEKSFARGASRVDGDATRLQQIFSNILSNAVKFTPAGGRIRVSLSSIDSQVQVEICDTGKGIGRDFLPRVFDSLSQEGGSSTREHGGLGLGLSIVRQLVQMHGGTVRAESEGEGRGSTFTVSLPARRFAVTVQDPSLAILHTSDTPPPGEAVSVAGMRILVVDDELDMRKLIATALRGAGASVVTAAGAAEAFDQLTKHSFDALVSDLAMPSEDGHSLARRIRARDDEKSQIPAVAVTAYGGPLQRQLALSAGFDDYVKKPFAPNDLVRAVANVARRAVEPTR
ncbi:MAG TPA: PAS domain S-box protein [Thermoanaerobaculia bacterium]|jgi:PAS domain S-box-containing protein|nr:PAS domain S-box protein [Thermoanaerobaculia bacterium]